MQAPRRADEQGRESRAAAELPSEMLQAAHGLTADPLASRYGPRLTPPPGAAGPAGLAKIPERHLIRRSPPPACPQKKETLMTTDQVLPGQALQTHRRTGPDARELADRRQQMEDDGGRGSRAAASRRGDAAAG